MLPDIFKVTTMLVDEIKGSLNTLKPFMANDFAVSLFCDIVIVVLAIIQITKYPP